MRQCAGDEALADAGGTGDEHVLLASDPVAARQLEHCIAIQMPIGSVVEILDTGLLAQVGASQTGLHTCVSARSSFSIDQKAEPFEKAELFVLWLGQLFAQGVGHTVEPQLLEFVECGMG